MAARSPFARLEAALAGIEPPFAVVDLDAFRANAADLVRRARGKPVTFTLRESPWLREGGLADMLVGDPTGDREALVHLGALDVAAPPVPVAKAGEPCERFNALLLLEGDRMVDEVPTYRGEGRAFP